MGYVAFSQETIESKSGATRGAIRRAVRGTVRGDMMSSEHAIPSSTHTSIYRRDVEAFVKDGKLRVGTWQLQAPLRVTITDFQQPSSSKKTNKKQRGRKQTIPIEFHDILLPINSPELTQSTVSNEWLVRRDEQ
jgi:hypothetical protein